MLFPPLPSPLYRGINIEKEPFSIYIYPSTFLLAGASNFGPQLLNIVSIYF